MTYYKPPHSAKHQGPASTTARTRRHKTQHAWFVRTNRSASRPVCWHQPDNVAAMLLEKNQCGFKGSQTGSLSCWLAVEGRARADHACIWAAPPAWARLFTELILQLLSS